ncbi:MAG TPA: sigma 54-interacting transcriptional regulator [Thermoanaerobaculia bacterium]|nr:sigma 54-interacting transcriptional regulator [Thermoanaerobaculia bacterium]
MNPRLMALSGPLRGSSFLLAEGETSIGRDPASTVAVGDASVSRRHAVVRGAGATPTIVDLDSLNGTFVNGVPVRERVLESGDEVRIGSSVFFFWTEEDPAAAAEIPDGSTARLAPADRPLPKLSSDFVGESRAIREAGAALLRAAASEATVLILGESGTGKELAARTIHRASLRARGPFVAMSGATLTEPLLESELFGHERGAFTGAVAQKRGRLETADGGTFFLDEVGELPPAVQAKLLRVLETRQFERVGGNRTISVDVRFVAATNRDLEAATREGSFRRDLFYRLNVVAIRLPPLRERRDDVPLLARFFAARFAEKSGKPPRGLSPDAQKALMRYDWPGNVRELANAIERAIVLGEGDAIRVEDLPESVLESSAGEASGEYHALVASAKRDLVRKAIDDAGGNVSEAARRLGLHPNYLFRLVKNLGVRTR